MTQARLEIRPVALAVAAVVLTAGTIRTAAQMPPPQPAPRVVDLKAADGTPLKATYFAAAKPGPGVLLFHQVNRTRKSWDDVAVQLAAAGINTLTVDLRGFGESGGTPYDKLKNAQRHDQISNEGLPGDRDTAWRYLVSQSGVERDVIGVGGAGLLGVGNSVQTAPTSCRGEIVGTPFRGDLSRGTAIFAKDAATTGAFRRGRQ